MTELKTSQYALKNSWSKIAFPRGKLIISQFDFHETAALLLASHAFQFLQNLKVKAEKTSLGGRRAKILW